MRKIIVAVMFAVLPLVGFAAEEGAHLDKAHVDLSDKASLQRGAKFFINNCLSCHSAKYMRYNRMGKDLGIPDDVLKKNFLALPTQKVGDTMSISMAPANAENFFGKQPPDLSVIARRRGADWLYTYFKSFYIDESRPFGVNNAVFKDVGMPDVFWNWEGMKKPVYETVTVNGEKEQVIKDFEYVSKGSMTPAEFDKTMHDLTNFMVYMGEPIRMERQRIGIWVLGFLAVFFVFAYLLKREYWKDVH